jgi:hypothetical protein
MPVKKKPETHAIAIPRIDTRRLELTLIGDSELVTHRWSDKAKQMIKDKQGKKAKGAKEKRDPEAEYNAALYSNGNGGYAFPASGFKRAAVSACRFVDGMAMTEARGMFHVVGDLVTIEGEPEMREDMVRIGMGVADIRYRPSFKQWRATISVDYNAAAISPEQLINLFNIAGFGVGVGEGRPEKTGALGWGRFHVATEEEVAK